jgi:phosphopantetheine--protein transferase-like protein
LAYATLLLAIYPLGGRNKRGQAVFFIRGDIEMITGTGTDIIEIDRIRKALSHPGFKERVFTPAEREYIGDHASSVQKYAGRFAAKEAVMKALGKGFPWLAIEILAKPSGEPFVRLHGHAAAVLGEGRIWVSISHCHLYATACAVAESSTKESG